MAKKQRRTGKYHYDVRDWLKEKGLSVYQVSVLLKINFRRMHRLVSSESASKVLLEDALKLYYFSEGELKLEQILGKVCHKPNATYSTVLGGPNTKSKYERFVEDTKNITKSKKVNNKA